MQSLCTTVVTSGMMGLVLPAMSHVNYMIHVKSISYSLIRLIMCCVSYRGWGALGFPTPSSSVPLEFCNSSFIFESLSCQDGCSPHPLPPDFLRNQYSVRNSINLCVCSVESIELSTQTLTTFIHPLLVF